MKPKLIFPILICFLAILLLNACTRNPTGLDQTEPEKTKTTLLKTAEIAKITATPTEEADQLDYPKIANLWGIYRLDQTPEFYANFDLMIPYSIKEVERVSAEIYQFNPQAMILHSQFGTKGREESDDLIHQWWVSKLGDPGYPCLLRDSSSTILITAGWKHPMVNLINPTCREQMAAKNIKEFLDTGKNTNDNAIYSGIYWDLLFGRISWLSDDIDSNLDGKPDVEEEVNEDYKKGVTAFLMQIRQAIPEAILMGNEAPIDYATLINGRLFEWQLQALLDGRQLYSWEEILNEYRQWAVSGMEPHTTILQNAPEESMQKKYGSSMLSELPQAVLDEAEHSYQRMRFGLTSALMGDGYYSFDYGKYWHGQFWWYDEYGRLLSDPSSSTLPSQGYLGQPTGDPFTMESAPVTSESHTLKDTIKDLITSPEEDIESYNVWARNFDHGIAIVNPTNSARLISLDKEYCRLNGTQAPLFEVNLDDNIAQHGGSWHEEKATFDQYGETAHAISNMKDSTITYRPYLLFAGEYEVFVWVAPEPGLSSEVLYKVDHNEGITSVRINQTEGVPGWRSLGKYLFESGDQQGVSIYSSATGKVIADAVKWASTARLNDGSRLDSLLIPAHDGTILVDCNLNQGGD